MYEFCIMAYDVAVIRCTVVALERNMSRPWLIEKIQILVRHKHLHCSLIDDLTISLYGYRIRYLVESNCEGEDYYRNDNRSQADEATNSLDANNERSIVENLDKFYKGKTVVIVAHRLSTVKNADQIVVIDHGKVVEVGNHESLTAKRGAYYNLVKNQLELGN